VCKDCGRQFVENPQNKRIPQQLWDMVDKLLLEKIPIAGISTGTEISEPWLQQYINRKYEHVPQQIDISKKGCLTVECEKCGLLSDSSATSNGFGWQLTAIPERLSGCMLGVAIVPVPRHYGNHCRQSTVDAPFVTPIFGLHMSRFFPKTDIEQLVKKAEKRTTLKGSILH